MSQPAAYTPTTWEDAPSTATTINAARLNNIETAVTANNGVARASLRVLVYASGAYPARPSGVPGGLVRYIGPTQPTTWLSGDEWINNS